MASQFPGPLTDTLGSLRGGPSPASSPAPFSDLDLGFLSSFVDDLPVQPQITGTNLQPTAESVSFAQPLQRPETAFCQIDPGFQLPQDDLSGFPLASFQPEFVQQSVQQSVHRTPQLYRPSLQAAAQHGRSSSRSSNESPTEHGAAMFDGLHKLESTLDGLYDSTPAADLSGQDAPDDVEKARAKNRNAQKKFRARQKVQMTC